MAATETHTEEYLLAYTGNRLLGVTIAFLPLEVLFVVMRFTSRCLIKLPMGRDDILIIPALVFSIALCTVSFIMIQHGGVGYHIEYNLETDPMKIVVYQKCLIAFAILYMMAVTFPKLVVVTMYLRVFEEKWSRIVAWIVVGVTITTAIANTLVTVLQCRPLAYFWDTTIVGGKCPVNIDKFLEWASFPNILTDITIILLPLRLIWNLQTTREVKLGLAMTFGTGSIGLITSCIRFHGFSTTEPSLDATWAAVNLMVYSIVESGTYLIAACLPACRPLLVYIRQKLPTRFGGTPDRLTMIGDYDISSQGVDARRAKDIELESGNRGHSAELGLGHSGKIPYDTGESMDSDERNLVQNGPYQHRHQSTFLKIESSSSVVAKHASTFSFGPPSIIIQHEYSDSSVEQS